MEGLGFLLSDVKYVFGSEMIMLFHKAEVD
jgi:hypothetical protein